MQEVVVIFVIYHHSVYAHILTVFRRFNELQVQEVQEEQESSTTVSRQEGLDNALNVLPMLILGLASARNVLPAPASHSAPRQTDTVQTTHSPTCV